MVGHFATLLSFRLSGKKPWQPDDFIFVVEAAEELRRCCYMVARRLLFFPVFKGEWLDRIRTFEISIGPA